MAAPILLTAGGGFNVLAALIPFVLAVSVASIVFFALRAHHRKKHPTEDDVNETNRQRREREKLKRQTADKVNAALRGEKAQGEHVPNGLRSGKYNTKKKK